MTSNNDDSNKKSVLSTNEYKTLCDFINDYKGLSIDCEMELHNKFPQIRRLTLKAILQTELNNRLRFQFWRYGAKAEEFLKRYEKLAKNSPKDSFILINIARKEKISPVMMCRSLLKVKYNLSSKTALTKLIRYPHLIEDPWLSANVAQCLCSDSQDGPLIDFRRRVLGEEYEFKLKQLAKKAGMHFYDENDLRRLGYDKTPDIKMILPFLYKGEVINWIESKANFGDIKTHKFNIQQQLNSYCNRFGGGIIIYWFGYNENIYQLPENPIGIIVLDDFPSKDDLQLLDLSEQVETAVTKVEAKI